MSTLPYYSSSTESLRYTDKSVSGCLHHLASADSHPRPWLNTTRRCRPDESRCFQCAHCPYVKSSTELLTRLSYRAAQLNSLHGWGAYHTSGSSSADAPDNTGGHLVTLRSSPDGQMKLTPLSRVGRCRTIAPSHHAPVAGRLRW